MSSKYIGLPDIVSHSPPTLSLPAVSIPLAPCHSLMFTSFPLCGLQRVPGHPTRCLRDSRQPGRAPCPQSGIFMLSNYSSRFALLARTTHPFPCSSTNLGPSKRRGFRRCRPGSHFGRGRGQGLQGFLRRRYRRRLASSDAIYLLADLADYLHTPTRFLPPLLSRLLRPPDQSQEGHVPHLCETPHDP